MNKKLIRYGVVIVVLAFVGYNSVYLKKLDAVKKEQPQKLTAAQFAKTFWETTLSKALDSAVAFETVMQLLQTKNTSALDALVQNKINSNVKYVLVKGKGVITAIKDDEIVLKEKTNTATLITDVIIGSAIRDVTGLIKLNDFDNSTAYNEASNEINRIANTTVIAALKKSATMSKEVNYIGCIEINNSKVNELKIIPLKIN